jgi:hypothetical protein
VSTLSSGASSSVLLTVTSTSSIPPVFFGFLAFRYINNTNQENEYNSIYLFELINWVKIGKRRLKQTRVGRISFLFHTAYIHTIFITN